MDETPTPRPVTAPRPVGYADWTRAGFFAALGVTLLGVLALTVWHLLSAALTILSPFVFATVFALLLDPFVDRLTRQGRPRGAAVGLVFGIFLLAAVLIGVIAVPMLANQASTLAESGPEYVARLKTYTDDFLAHHRTMAGITLPRNFDALSAQLSESISTYIRSSAGRVTAFLLGSISLLLDTVVTLIVTFYLLLDIDRLRARLLYLLPEKWRGAAQVFAGDIGRVFSEYLRGLFIVSSLYGVATLLLLLALSIPHHEIARYALLVAVAGGLLYTVPYVGPLVTALITFLVSFAAGGIGIGIGAIVATIVLNQIFDNVVTPRVVGGGVGLHPVASLFALTLGGALFGLWGLLLSVPVAASIQAILFHLFPKLTTPTPPAFLESKGLRPGESHPPTILKGEEAPLP